jgi:hypothetical protein
MGVCISNASILQNLKDVDGNKHEGTQENVNIQWESPCNIQWGLQREWWLCWIWGLIRNDQGH